MNIKFLGAVAALAIGFSGEAAFADDAPAAAAPTPEFTVTGAASIVSQYKFRGLTQSDSRPTVQGTFTVSHKSGFYVSMWGSGGSGDRNFDFANGLNTAGDFYASPNNGTEIDVYGGYTHGLGKSGLTIDGGLYGYIYPNRTANNLFEVYGDLSKSYGPVTAKIGLNWAPKQHYFNLLASNITHYNMYVYGELGFTPVKSPAFTFHSHVGHTGGGLDFVKPYVDYVAGISYKWKALTFDISAVGTSISKSDVANHGLGAEGTNFNNSVYRYGKFAPVGSITASF
jgi:uncharacterized protein (TIGR02001 family)